MKYDKYMPVIPDFYDIVESISSKTKDFKVFYFDPELEVLESKSRFIEILKNENGEYLILKDDDNVRLDRIITINGNPGPAYDEYESFANACLSCQAGYDD